ncbi:antitoxin [Xanthomonas sp. WHRI 8391]|uniref:Antitoxin ParD n=1 Tax=Xanthomonas hortorum pv. carotae TaxID=487904 RepID=A0A6V7FN95_9XANT|nr:ParD [Xanthomonas hortorum]ETC83305.1 ParD [Xanthomonas hortorum pv. carotae str. M081]MBG3851652.1 antitoxin [Xanthomonas hortorum pv. carotae]UTS74419.1 antitoxin [Xanthomonas hortorum]CAD0364778.1 Antitoxin ParD [Xanthomonas hortorum pv. carotae]CAD0364779.1 Antitoxin ParD [Xanthomonas hortorum pv. carotae]
MSRLTIDLNDQQQQSLKALAPLQGKTIKQYALERLFPDDDENPDQAWQQLKNLLGGRVEEGLAGKVSTKSVSAILDEELAESRRG